MQNLYNFIPDAHNEFSLDYILEDMSVDEEEDNWDDIREREIVKWGSLKILTFFTFKL
jgi:hypothetical protein